MPLDFTLSAFDGFCRRISDLPVFTVADFLTRAGPPPACYVILRADVDYREAHAVDMARIAARHGVRGSFYFRHHRSGFDLPSIRIVESLGHEVGYHFETLDTCCGDYEAAKQLFMEHVEGLRAVGLTIRTVAAHGGRVTVPTYRANYDLFVHFPGLLEQVGLLGETTLSLDFSSLVYVSDAGWRWRQYAAYVPGKKGQATSLQKTSRALTDSKVPLYINFHPHQWFAHPTSACYFRARHMAGRMFYRAKALFRS